MKNRPEWLKANSLSELQKLGSFSQLRRRIKQEIGPGLKVVAGSWETLLDAIKSLRTLNESIEPSEEPAELEFHTNGSYTSPYFKSEVAEIIYALVEESGERQQHMLGLDSSFYRDKRKAKEWRNRVAAKIHPDMCSHPHATEASEKLNELYQRMTKYGR